MDTSSFDNGNTSSFQGRLVHQQQDEFGNIIVTDLGHQRLLSFDHGLIQSRKDVFRPNALVHEYLRAMLLGLVFSPHSHVTILGLGGGCLVRALNTLFRDIQISAVELRGSVADITRQYFGLPNGDKFDLNIGDAFEHLSQQAPASTDIILSDLYNAHSEEQIQSDMGFLKECCRALSDKGCLVVNHHNAANTDSPIYKELSEIFAEIYICSTSDDNHVLYAVKTTDLVPQQLRMEQVNQYQSALKSRLDLLYRKIFRLRDGVFIEHLA